MRQRLQPRDQASQGPHGGNPVAHHRRKVNTTSVFQAPTSSGTAHVSTTCSYSLIYCLSNVELKNVCDIKTSNMIYRQLLSFSSHESYW